MVTIQRYGPGNCRRKWIPRAVDKNAIQNIDTELYIRCILAKWSRQESDYTVLIHKFSLARLAIGWYEAANKRKFHDIWIMN